MTQQYNGYASQRFFSTPDGNKKEDSDDKADDKQTDASSTNQEKDQNKQS